MKPTAVSYHSHLFHLRLWQECIDADRYEWRGQITSVATGETQAFRTADQLVAGLRVLVRALSWEGFFPPEAER